MPTNLKAGFPADQLAVELETGRCRVIKPRDVGDSAPKPMISVVICYEHPRANTEHVLTWTREQTLAAGDFEVIAVSNGRRPQIEVDLVERLRPHDLLLQLEGRDRFEMCNEAAALARADCVFFTEDHCKAEPGCLELVLRVLREGGEAVTVGWASLNKTVVGAFEEKVTESFKQVWHQPQHWNKLRARGVAVTRRAFGAAGQFPPGMGLFSEVMLAARLHAMGVKPQYTPEVGVRRFNSETLADVRWNAWNYTHHECVASEKVEPEFFDRYFNLAEVRLSWLVPAREARVTLPLVWREWRRAWHAGASRQRSRRVMAWTNLALATGLRALLRPLPRWGARSSVAAAWLRYWIWGWNRKRRYDAFADYWSRMVTYTRAVSFCKTGWSHIPANSLNRYEGSTLGQLHAWGMGPVEHASDGTAVRWTGSLAVIPFDLSEGDHRVTLETAGLRGGDARFPLEIYWGHHRVSRREMERVGGSISFVVAGTGRPRPLRIMVPVQLRSEEGRRWLGMPLTGVEVTELEGETAADEDQAAGTCTAGAP